MRQELADQLSAGFFAKNISGHKGWGWEQIFPEFLIALRQRFLTIKENNSTGGF